MKDITVSISSQLYKRGMRGTNIILMMAYFLVVKTFNVSLDVSTLLLVLDTSWEVAVHSYYIATENDQILRVNCNLVQYDRNLQKPHLLEVITTVIGSVHFLRWKKVLIANPADFRVSITDLQNTPVDVKSNSHILLAFKKV